MTFDRIEAWLETQKDNFILWLPIFLGIGAACYFGLIFEPGNVTVLALWFLSGLIVCLLYLKRHSENFKLLWIFFALSIFLTFSGFALAKLKTNLIAAPVLIKETRPVMVEGRVTHTEVLEGNRGTLVILEDNKIENFEAEETPDKLRLTSKLRVRFNLGDRVQMLAKLTPPSMPVMPGAYDFRRHYFFDGIGAMGFILKAPVVIEPASATDYNLFLEKLRQSMGAHIKSILPARLAGIATALITGERAAIIDEDWDALRISGLAHIISISGLHVVLFATPIFFFSRFIMACFPAFALRFPIKKIAALIALIGCSLYVALVVPTVPTYRALLMTGIGLIAVMMDRSPFSLRLISFAACVVLILAPESIWSASFQLSFTAVLSLIMAAEWTREYWSRWRNNASVIRKFLIYLGGSIFTTLVVSIVTAPLASYHFQQIPVYSVLANALIIPLSALIIMPMIIATFMLWPFGLQDNAIRFLGYGIEWMLAIAHGTAELPGAYFNLSAWPMASMLCFAASALMLILLKKRLKFLCLIGFIAGVSFIVTDEKPFFLASQKGNLVLVRDHDNVYLSSSRKEKFAAETWIKRLGEKDEVVAFFPEEGHVQLSDGSISCGGNMCRIVKGNHLISFGTDQYALREDCAWADIIVTSTAFRQKNCKAKVYNKFELMRTGALELKEMGRVKTVSDTIGVRPWSPAYPRFNGKSGSNSPARPESERGQASERAVYKHHSQVPE